MPKKIRFTYPKNLTKRQQATVLFAFVVVGAVAMGIAILAITANPKPKLAINTGGFVAGTDYGADLGIGNVVSKVGVVDALGNNAKSVGDKQVSDVFNLNGDHSQTLTYPFVRADGKNASISIDVTEFQSVASMTNTNIYSMTEKTKPINGLPAFYMVTQVLGTDREFRLMVVDGLHAYKFIIDQPSHDVTISEVSSEASLIRLAQRTQLLK